MRIESFRINTQPNNSSQPKSKWILLLLICLYAYVLKLYPAAFRADFADEMIDVFAMTLREARGILDLLSVVWREALELPINIIRVRQQRSVVLTSSINVWRVRQVTRWSSLILSLFMMHSIIKTLLTPNPFSLDAVRLGVFFGLLFLTSVSMLLAWRWERLGGMLTMGGGIAVGSFLTFYIGYFHPVQISLIGLALIGILWALPFVTFGLLFCHLSQCQTQQMDLAYRQQN